MKTSSKNWLAGALGALIGLAVVAALAMDATPPGSATLAQGLLDDASLGHAVAEFIGLAISAALVGFGLRQLAMRNAGQPRLRSREGSIAVGLPAPAVALSVPGAHDATASELDDDTRLPGFAPVLSLTEARLGRQRAQRQQRERRTALEST